MAAKRQNTSSTKCSALVGAGHKDSGLGPVERVPKLQIALVGGSDRKLRELGRTPRRLRQSRGDT